MGAQHAGLIAQLEQVDAFPEKAVADADKSSLGAAAKTRERADTLEQTPKLAGALDDGKITAGHIDAVTRRSTSTPTDATNCSTGPISWPMLRLRQLHLGRTTRLANRAQRRALRALYSSCAIPGCTGAYDRCKLHHVPAA